MIDLMERLNWLSTAPRGAEPPNWMFENQPSGDWFNWDHGIRITSAEALAEIERLRERVIELLSSNNAFEQRARLAEGINRENNKEIDRLTKEQENYLNSFDMGT